MPKVPKKCRKSATEYYCGDCDYYTSHKSHYKKHLDTRKHLEKALPNVTKALPKVPKRNKKVYVCDICEKKYKSRKGLWGHKKICISYKSESEEEEEKVPPAPTPASNLIQLTKEQFDMLLNHKTMGNHNTNCNNTYNNNITVQVYLDDYCKDAKSIESIVKKFKNEVEYKLKDIAYPSNLQFIKDAPSDLFIKEIKKMPAEERPVHCADGKRGKFWVKKEEKGWVKEDVYDGGVLKAQIGVFKSNVFLDVQDDINKKGKGEDLKYQVAKGKFFKEMFEKTAVDNNIIAKLATECNIKDAIKDIEDKE
jgi:hypothetical protein